MGKMPLIGVIVMMDNLFIKKNRNYKNSKEK